MKLNQLPPFQKRRFVPTAVNLHSAAEVSALYERLSQRTVASPADLEQWILDRSELDAALSEAGSILYIEMTCHTDDQAVAQAYTNFISTVPPAIKPINDRLNKMLLRWVKQFPLDLDRYGVYFRATTTDVELFKEENVPLQTEVDLISQEYQTVCGAMTVHFKGQEQTMPAMGKYLLENDRVLREEAWRASAERRLQDKDKLEELFHKMFDLRNTVARNAGFKNFIDYQFKAYHRFDYTPDDCKKYHETIERLIVPLNGMILKQRKEEMKLASLRPWDTSVDPLGRAPLKPFTDVADLIKGSQTIFNRLDSQLGKEFKEMRDLELLDLASRKGKAPGGYQNTLSESRKPFIFMNAVGVDDDVRTLLHEGGHAFHALASAQDPLLDYRHAPMEFCEVASMAMELLGGRYINTFYNEEDTKRSNREHLEGIIHVLAWVANIDAFQHWMYERPNHSDHERRQAWLGFYEQFGGKFIDWNDDITESLDPCHCEEAKSRRSNLNEVKAYLWHRQLHIFEVPFYYIEYGIAQLGALQVWRNAKKDAQYALSKYRQALALGGSKTLPQLYKAAGIEFDFSEGIIRPLIEEVTQEWKKLI